MKILKKSIKKKLVIEPDTLKIIFSGIFCYILLMLVLFAAEQSLKKSEINQQAVWNNGVCGECGGNWVYKEDHPVVAGYLHIYECDTCHRIAEFTKMY